MCYGDFGTSWRPVDILITLHSKKNSALVKERKQYKEERWNVETNLFADRSIVLFASNVQHTFRETAASVVINAFPVVVKAHGTVAQFG